VLPDFREVKEKLDQALTQRLREQVKKRDPVLAMIRTLRQHEGHRHVWSTDKGRERSTAYEPAVAEVTINQHETVDWTIADIVRHVDNMADQMIGQIVPNMFATLREASDEVGNVVDGGGRPFSFEMWLEAVEKLQIEFDEHTGQPRLPTMVVNPTLGERVRALLPEWERNAEYKARSSALIARKKEDWDDREGNRKLVD
jgi:hypothetical protein